MMWVDLEEFRKGQKWSLKRLARELRISERYLQRLGSPLDFVANPLPRTIVKRFTMIVKRLVSKQKRLRPLRWKRGSPEVSVPLPIPRAVKRGRGRRLGAMQEITQARITIAAASRWGDTTYSMKGELFPKQRSAELAYKSAKDLFKRYGRKINLEEKRLQSLSRKDLLKTIQDGLKKINS